MRKRVYTVVSADIDEKVITEYSGNDRAIYFLLAIASVLQYTGSGGGKMINAEMIFLAVIIFHNVITCNYGRGYQNSTYFSLIASD